MIWIPGQARDDRNVIDKPPVVERYKIMKLNKIFYITFWANKFIKLFLIGCLSFLIFVSLPILDGWLFTCVDSPLLNHSFCFNSSILLILSFMVVIFDILALVGVLMNKKYYWSLVASVLIAIIFNAVGLITYYHIVALLLLVVYLKLKDVKK